MMRWLSEVVEPSIDPILSSFFYSLSHPEAHTYANIITHVESVMEVLESKLVTAALGFEYYFPGTLSDEKHEFETKLKLNTNPPSFKRKRGDVFSHDADDDDDFPLSFKESGKFEFAKPQHPDHIEAESVVIEKGKTLDVVSLLSGDNDDGSYLGRVHGGVGGIEILKDKYVLVCCFYAPILHRHVYIILLLNLYLLSLELCGKRCDFEMVLVVKIRPEWAKDTTLASSHFQHFISAFSPFCMFVPFEHTTRIHRICKSVNMEKPVSGFLVGPDGVVVQDCVSKLAPLAAGKDVFPFTDDKLRYYNVQKWRGKTLEDLLESEGCRVLYNNGGDKQVSVSELARKKVVGLYLCGTGYDIPLLDRVYNECRAKQLEFEIVLVYNPFVTHTSPLVLQEVIGRFLDKRKISWWVFPYSHFTVRRLFNLVYAPITDKLLTVFNGKLVDYQGEMLVRGLGINGYPFDRESVIQKGMEQIQEVTLESLLAGGSLRRGNDPSYEVPVTYLRGRNVLLFIGSAERSNGLYILLEKHYNSIKKKHAGFEVVFVNLDTNLSNKVKHLMPSMPWLVFHPDTRMSQRSVVKQLSTWGLEPVPALVAFGENGWICSLNASYALEDHGPYAFPFYDDVHEQIRIKLQVHLSDYRWSGSQ